MACEPCAKKALIRTRVNLTQEGDIIPNNPEHDLVGNDVLTTIAREGKVIKNVVNNDGVVVGYILSDSSNNTFSIFRNQILQQK